MRTQVDMAMEQASLLRLASSQAKQLGFKVLAAHYLTEARKAEKFAAEDRQGLGKDRPRLPRCNRATGVRELRGGYRPGEDTHAAVLEPRTGLYPGAKLGMGKLD